MDYQEAKDYQTSKGVFVGESISIVQQREVFSYPVVFELILPNIEIWKSVQSKIDIGYTNDQVLKELGFYESDLDVWLILKDERYILLRDYLNTTV